MRGELFETLRARSGLLSGLGLVGVGKFPFPGAGRFLLLLLLLPGLRKSALEVGKRLRHLAESENGPNFRSTLLKAGRLKVRALGKSKK